ncbi:hypothetical protein KY289_005198 [Solanum tuberosum]|nr:hypothetical protein KY289_005198 [Solanum tuberosum]
MDISDAFTDAWIGHISLEAVDPNAAICSLEQWKLLGRHYLKGLPEIDRITQLLKKSMKPLQAGEAE